MNSYAKIRLSFVTAKEIQGKLLELSDIREIRKIRGFPSPFKFCGEEYENSKESNDIDSIFID